METFFTTDIDTTVRVAFVTNVEGYWRMIIGKHHITDGTLHAIPTRTITDPNGNEHTITAVDHDAWFEVEAEDEPASGLWILPKLTFHAGTPRNINAELAKQMESQMPMVWLLEVMQEEIGISNLKDAIVPIMRLFFLDSADYSNWTRVEHMEEAVRPMRNYAYRATMHMAHHSGRFSQPKVNPVFINHVMFGRSYTEFLNRDADSHKKNIFSEHTSGMEVRLELPIRRKCYE
jgi:hypothetical protein